MTDRANVYRNSVYQAAKSFLESTAIWGTGFNVFGESQLRSRTFVPTRPFCYLLDEQVIFKAEALPMLIVETTEIDAFSFELGDSYQWYGCTIHVHCFGKTRTERNNLVGRWVSNVREIPMLDPITGTQALTETGGSMTATLLPFAGEKLWVADRVQVGDVETFEASLRNWTAISGRFQSN